MLYRIYVDAGMKNGKRMKLSVNRIFFQSKELPELGNMAAERVHEDPREQLSERARNSLSFKCEVLRYKGASEALILELAEISAAYFGESAPQALKRLISCLRHAEVDGVAGLYRDCCEYFVAQSTGSSGSALTGRFGFTENKRLCRFEKLCLLPNGRAAAAWFDRSWPLKLHVNCEISSVEELAFMRGLEGAKEFIRMNRPGMDGFESALRAWLEAAFRKYEILRVEAKKQEEKEIEERLMKYL